MFRRRGRPAADFSEELRAHLELEMDELHDEGLSEQAAYTKARHNLGNLTGHEESFYERSHWMWLDHLKQDLQYALRQWLHAPGFALTAVLTLALGIGGTDPNLPVIYVQSFGEQVSRTLTQQALLARLTLLFGLTALVLVSIGTYGVTAYAIQGRTKEIGIRMALGADRMKVLGLVAKDAFLLVGVGLALGLPLSLAVGRLLSSRLYGIGSYDPRIVFGAVLVLAVSTAAAVLLPASRAAWMAPMAALRRD